MLGTEALKSIFFHFHAVFWEDLPKKVGCHSLGLARPLHCLRNEKFWILHCLGVYELYVWVYVLGGLYDETVDQTLLKFTVQAHHSF